MKNYVIKKAHLVDGRVVDILVENGIIKEVAPEVITTSKAISFGDNYVSAGWIDMHTHCFDKFKTYGDQADLVGFKQGVCTVIDAGTAGCDTIDEFYKQASNARTRVYSLLNVACTGIFAQDELSDVRRLKMQGIIDACNKYPRFIVGIKARMSKSVIGDSGNQPLVFAKSVQEYVKLPFMVHIGTAPAIIDDVVNMLDQGDIITHTFNPKDNGIKDGVTIKKCIYDAIDKGVYLDLGHGTDSFSFDVAQLALEHDIKVDVISSDIYFKNRINGPVYNLATTMTKLLAIGYSLEEVIDKVTYRPAKIIGLSQLGQIDVGKIADFTIFKLQNGNIELTDSTGKVVKYNQTITPTKIIVKNEIYNLLEDE